MPIKLAALTLLVVGLAGTLLVIRQQRIDVAHETAALRGEIEQLRHDVWRAEAEASYRLQPDGIRQRIESIDLVLEPAVPAFEKPIDVLADQSSQR